jgi:DNA-binding transcriptional LysR family regulator
MGAMDSADLTVFEAVAREGGITRAAAALHTVQSNVSARIQALERELGVPLFHRHSRGVALTSAGEALLPYAVRVGALLEEARRVASGEGEPRGPLHIGSLETTAGLRLPPVLAAFSAAHPAVDLTLQTGTTRELIAAVLNHQLEGALVVGPVGHAELIEERIFVEELVLVTSPRDASLEAALRRASGGRLLVLRAGCSYRERLERLLTARGIAGARLLEFGTLEGIIGCAAAGMGVTLLPRGVVQSARHAGRVAVHELPPHEAFVETVFIRRADGFVSAALARFIAACRQASETATGEREREHGKSVA